MQRTIGAVVAAVAVTAVVAACAPDSPADDMAALGGWTLEVVRTDLDGPTQLALGPDGSTVYVAELAGEEDAGTGRVLVLGRDGGADLPIVALDGLETPTGLVVLDDATFLVQEGRALVRHDVEGAIAAGEPTPDAVRTVLVEDLPWNGRSQGTLTLLDDGRVLHSATHEGAEPDLVEGSGAVYATPVDGSATPELVATGFKVPYAHAIDEDGRLWVTDLNEGRADGVQLPDEVHRFEGVAAAPSDGGWPRCAGSNDPVDDFGFGAADCEDLPPPAVVLPARSSPTGIAIAGGRVLVALFTTPFAVDGRVVEVGDDGTITDVLRDVATPQDVLALPDGSFLVTTHLDGQLLRLTPP